MSTIAKRRKPERATLKAPARSDSLSNTLPPTLFLAVVHAADGVRFSAVAESRWELVHRIADYVRQWGGYLLRPDHARHLRGLLARGEWEAAIELYFGLVGKRWDKEWLVTAVTTTDGRKDVAGVLGEVVVPEALQAPRRPRGGRDQANERDVTVERTDVTERRMPLARAL